jgi:hypothetical protein
MNLNVTSARRGSASGRDSTRWSEAALDEDNMSSAAAEALDPKKGLEIIRQRSRSHDYSVYTASGRESSLDGGMERLSAGGSPPPTRELSRGRTTGSFGTE